MIRQEEAHLRKLFSEQFEVYSRSVPFFFPRLFPSRKIHASRGYFRWDLYWRNREYEAFLAYIGIIFFLLMKSFLTSGT